MNNFKRENRYVVFKRKNLSHAQGKVLHSVESELCPDGNVKECLVVEHDWPCYDAAWNMIVKLSEGEFSDPYAEITQLRERVKELEIEKQLLISEIEPLLDMQDGGEYYTRNSLADDIYEKFIGGSSAEALNKFALEQKIEVLREYRRRIKGWGVETRNVDVMIEQLRKGGES